MKNGIIMDYFSVNVFGIFFQERCLMTTAEDL